jgi:hypothetical protein
MKEGEKKREEKANEKKGAQDNITGGQRKQETKRVYLKE